jgi:uncharacterized protein (DUF1810 family)
MRDDFNLQRFVQAQQPVYAAALAELKGGRKQSHWMWFVFPQVAGLGRSTMAKHYAIRSRNQAVAYLGSPLLGTRLAECTRAVLDVEGRSAHDIFGSPDDLKFRSSMTLFDTVDRANANALPATHGERGSVAAVIHRDADAAGSAAPDRQPTKMNHLPMTRSQPCGRLNRSS